MPSNRWKTNVLASPLIALLIAAVPSYGQTVERNAITVADFSSSLEATTRLVSPAVVEIFTTAYTVGNGMVPGSADLVNKERASGSGVIVDADGYIITNAHVVRGSHRLRVEIPTRAAGRSILANSSRTVAAQIVGMDLETDLAVIKVDAQDLPALAFGDSDELSSGQLVLAFGSPLGFRNSVSLGVVSSVARQLEPESAMIYIQTDASINPGSSGGPLVDLRGHIVGINTMLVSESGGNDGLGFSAPSNIVRNVYEQIRRTGRVRRGDIGLRTQTVNPVLAAGLHLSRNYGAIVADVMPGSPADRVGLRAGDLIVALEGEPIENGRQLQVRLYRYLVGDRVSLDILRGTETLRVRVAIAERPDDFDVLSSLTDPRENLVQRLGVLGVNLDRRIAQILPALRVPSGVVVVSTVDGAIDTRDGGLAAGDIIYSVNRVPVRSLEELRSILEQMKKDDSVVLQLERRGGLIYLAFTME